MSKGRYCAAVPPHRPRVAGYLRGDDDAIIDQTATLRRWCTQNRLVLRTTYSDPAGPEELLRTGLISVIAAARAGAVEGIAVATMTAIAADPVVQEQVRTVITEAGSRLYAADDDATPERALIRHTLDVTAGNRVQITRLNTRTGRLRAKYGVPPYGWTLRDGVEVPVPEQQQVIGTILAWRADGLTLQQIADRLNTAGIPGARSGPWYRKTVNAVLHRAQHLPDQKEPIMT